MIPADFGAFVAQAHLLFTSVSFFEILQNVVL